MHPVEWKDDGLAPLYAKAFCRHQYGQRGSILGINWAFTQDAWAIIPRHLGIDFLFPSYASFYVILQPGTDWWMLIIDIHALIFTNSFFLQHTDTLRDDEGQPWTMDNDRDETLSCKCIVDYLQHLVVTDYRGGKAELEFIKVVLRRGRELEWVTITPTRRCRYPYGRPTLICYEPLSEHQYRVTSLPCSLPSLLLFSRTCRINMICNVQLVVEHTSMLMLPVWPYA